MAETLRASPFDQTASKYANYSFSVQGVTNGTGTVTTFVDEMDNSADAQILGLPRDLDGDGVATKTNVTSGYELLPIRIGITWTGRDGQETKNLYILLADESN